MITGLYSVPFSVLISMDKRKLKFKNNDPGFQYEAPNLRRTDNLRV